MKIKQVLLLAFLSAATFAFAQTEQSEKTYKNDIGFNTVFILNSVFNSNQTPFSLMYKRYTSENKAIRLGVSVNADWNKLRGDDTLYSNSSNNLNSVFAASIAIGKEFQARINTKWVWYYGGDLVPSYNASNYSYYQNGIKTFENVYRNYGISARPFLGIRFAINQRLYLSAEANVSLGYRRNTNKFKYFNSGQPDQNTVIENFSFSMSPASGLYLYYRF